MAKSKVPFPDEEQILEFIRENPGRASKREISRAFHIRGDEKIQLKKLLRKMKLDGKLATASRSRLQVADELPPVLVIEVDGVDSHGDLTARPQNWDSDDHPPKILIYAHDRRNRLGIGDHALVRLTPNKDDSESGYIAKVIRKLEKKKSTQIMGIFRSDDDHIAFVNPTDKKDRNKYLIAKNDWNGALDGSLVLIQIKPGRQRSRQIKAKPAKVIKSFGSINDAKSISLIAIMSQGIAIEFPEEVLNEAQTADQPTLGNRVDLRDIPLITVDPSDARDHDDAIWAEMDPDPDNQGGCHIIVAIADVAHYVKPGSALDKEALKRGNSTYFPDRVVPMLPESLSNGLCSLHENEDRYTMAVHIWFDKKGKKIRHKFIRALMRSHGSLSYEEFQYARDGIVSDRAEPLLETVINPLYDAYNILKKGREFREPLDLHMPEKKITLNDDGHIASIKERVSLDAHKLVEEFMIQANVAAAEELERKQTPCMYRIHEQPSMEKVEGLRTFLDSLGYSFSKGQVLKPKIFNSLLKKVKESPQEDVISTIVLRTQMQAEYNPENHGHFGLSLTRYAHFTSPIRRYADVLVHRGLIKALKLGKDGLSPFDAGNMVETAEHISQTERNSMIAERQSTERYIAHYMSERIDEEFDGKINGVHRAGLFITLNETGGEGFIPASSLYSDYFHYDKEHHLLEGENSKIIYQLGDSVHVRLKEANPVSGGLIFELIDERLHKIKGRKSNRRPRKRKRK
ncbi:ribonuclease R [Pseudemcibacter aquimaris]|uniref:ribonuclease R n=1 Tax=Pseudemcibacter aquimaris TaxID=2857064 RepID=UPI0020129C99|nr:ribonuclease R [Pseudemcibacter aquimaris]MCC3860491.1 ribonuclease R [Pseudemcibacter aquimaris]WDU59316.1 ribonuclease R [Pseudemcibacter aquimaris]